MIFGHSNNLNRIMSFTVKSNNPNLIYPCFLAIGLLSLYLTTMPDFATLEDSGLFIAVAHEPVIAHPPGYPLYTILAHLLAWIPLGTVAQRVQTLSAFAGIAACLLLFKICKKLGSDNFSVVIASTCLGVSSSFWFLAITDEVYTLNVMFFMLLFNLALNIHEKPNNNFPWIGFALISGLSFTNHWPLMLISFPALILIIISHFKVMLRNGFKMAFFFLAGLSPYLYLPIRSWYEPYLTFFQPLPDWQRFWWNITREAYSNGDQSGTWNDSFLFVVNFYKTLPKELAGQH